MVLEMGKWYAQNASSDTTDFRHTTLTVSVSTVHSLDFHSNLYPTSNIFRETFMFVPCLFLQSTDPPNKTQFMTSIKLRVSAPRFHPQELF